MPSPRPEITVVKLGGSQAASPYLRRWLEAIAAEAGAIVVVPGGGPFADAVRRAQASMGFDASAAHDMAMMAMAQFGRALQSLNPELRPADSLVAIRRALKERKVPVWAPGRMARAAGLPETWDLTSDSLAAWLAGRVNAGRLVLVKHSRQTGRIGVHDLVAQGVVDPLFPRFMRERRFRVLLAAPADAARLADGLRGGAFPEIVPGEGAIGHRAPAAE